jgi:hypothetical protein
MLKYFQKKYAMSEKGARDLLRSIIWTVFLDLSFMAPVVLSFKFLDEYLNVLLNPANNPPKQRSLLCDHVCRAFPGDVCDRLFSIRLDLYQNLRRKCPQADQPG